MAITWNELAAGRERYEGRVLGKFNRVERVMSDIYDDVYYALVWNGQASEAVNVGYSTQVVVDATPEVLAAWRTYRVEQVMARLFRDATFQAYRLDRGVIVKVVRGRKIPKGSTGVVFWSGMTQYGLRVGLDMNGDRQFTASSNVEVIPSHLPSMEDFREQAVNSVLFLEQQNKLFVS